MLTVSNYHYIREDFATPFPSIFGVTPVAFKSQLENLKTVGRFIAPKELLANTDDILNSKENYILVTFDDGLKEQFELAKPILDSLRIEALYFINSINFIEKEVSLVHKIHLLRSQIAPSDLMQSFTGLSSESSFELTSKEKIKAVEHYNFDDIQSAYLKYFLNFKLSTEQLALVINSLFSHFFDRNQIVEKLYMNEEQLKILANENQLGSHTHSHLALGLLTDEKIKSELEITKNYLEDVTKTKISFVSYPFGSPESYQEPVPLLAKKIGYEIGFTMERGINVGSEDKLLLKRFDCNDMPSGKNEKVFRDEYSVIN